MIDLNQKNILTDNLKTLKETSFDDSNKVYMSQSSFPAVDFDDVKDSYILNKSLTSTHEMRSNDALVILNYEQGLFVFIEFKNGIVTSKSKIEEIRTKISESLLILNDVLHEDLTFDKNNINYILVYNKQKNEKFENQRNDDSLNQFATILAKKAHTTYLIDGFGRYKAFFHDVKTINETEFKTISDSLENATYKF